MSVAEALTDVLARVRAAEQRAGRAPGSARLVAVSKTFPAEAIHAAWLAGHRDFGENRAQELRDKAPALPSDIAWHFIGRLQANKAKYVAPLATRIHALEGLEQAEALARRTERKLVGLVEVNIGREPQKGGVLPEACLPLCEALALQGAVEVRGLMCVPPASEDPQAATPFFEELAALAAAGRAAGLPLDELSMGMSHDFELAIACGATWVRVGTAIFGARG